MVQIELLQIDDYGIAATWLSQGEINAWLASGWRGKVHDAKVLSILSMNSKNRLFLVRWDGIPCGLVALWGIDEVDKNANLWYLLGDQQFSGRGAISNGVRQVID